LRYEARFVVDTHAHITTLYKPKGMKESWDLPEGWTGLGAELEPFDNSAFTLYDMGRYGVDMCVLKPSIIGTTNTMQAMLVDKYPDKFRALCSDQKQKLKVFREKCDWSLDVAVEEVEEALKTGKFVGIGEFVPGCMGLVPRRTYTFRQRLDEFRKFMELAAKYDVTIDFHEFSRTPWGGPGSVLLSAVATEYPDVSIIFCHGGRGSAAAVEVAAGATGRNVYLECGSWPAENFKAALTKPNVGATQLIWGHDYGNVPQVIIKQDRSGQNPISYPRFSFSRRQASGGQPGSQLYERWPGVPSYQTDFWGWSLHQIHRLKDWNWVTQDEVNLILGGNAAKIFKLQVPFERMFPEGRSDLFGSYWEKSVPFIPRDQVKNPDYP
jgi:predicted TIM-barrel fold metal-dependent hydrolase